MKNISTGTGIALLAGAIAAYPIIDRVMPRAEAGATHVAAVIAAATAQVPPEPTIVWYGVAHNPGGLTSNNNWHYPYTVITRAWSDGRIEATKVCAGSNCGDPISAGTSWTVVSTPESGYNASADINFDSKVDGSDLSQVLNDWGNAPRHDIVPSTCPLNLINSR